MSIPTIQKDYRPLSNHHTHINRLKNNNINNNNNSITSNNLLNNSVNSNNLIRSLTTSISENVSLSTTTAATSPTSPISSTSPIFLNNNHYHHHHQHNNNNNNNILSNNIMRKSYTPTDPSNVSFNSASVAGSIQDDMSDQCSLTQAGLEEYNSRSYYDQPVFHHQKQSSYAQSEGYHSYVSSSDSSSATPFLDRLRQESELLSRQSHHWSQNDLSPTSPNNSGNSMNITSDNNSSESTSSTETLKWLGSMSDVSVASHATNSSAISGSVSLSSQLIVHSSRVRTPKRQNSESVLYMNDDQMSVTNETTTTTTITNNNRNNNNNNINDITSNKTQTIFQHYHQTNSIKDDDDNDHQMNSTKSSDGSSLNGIPSLSLVSNVSAGTTTGTTTTSTSLSLSSSSLSSSSNYITVVTTTSIPTTLATSSSSSSSNLSYRNNHRLFPLSTYTEPVNGTTTTTTTATTTTNSCNNTPLDYQQSAQPQQQSQQISGILSSPQSHNWQSVADRINDFERQQQHLSGHHHHHNVIQQSHSIQKYTYIDPSKTHRVPNPTLKAFQKNAVQSYFERQQHNAKENINNKNYSSTNNVNRPQSLQLSNSPKEVPLSHLRNSLPNNYSEQNLINKKSLITNNLIMSHIQDDLLYSDCGIPPPPPPRSRSLMPIRRSSSASEYSDFREHYLHAKEKQSHMIESHMNSISSPEKLSFNDCGVPPPPPPPRSGRHSMPIRRTSSASEYAAVRDKNIQAKQNLSKDLLGPIIMGPIISVDDWVPERPPKNPHLRIPSPDLPPPPIQIIDTDTSLLNQDEPLPPPPPEILRHMRQNSDNEMKPSSPNRRNSFAGSPSRKTLYRASTFENLAPSIPKKPSTMDMIQTRPASSLAQSHKAHKVILNGKLESSTNLMSGSYPSPEQFPRSTDSRISVRKRTHNTNSPIMNPIDKSPGKMNSIKSPPPLKPRMPIAGQEIRASSVAISSKLRCNSKASYLPRQSSRDKPNITDPDHGSYKLTLTSNEDCINHNTITPQTSYHDDILISPTKCNNLPDVLPIGVKTMQQHQQQQQQQPSSPSSSGSSPRYGSNNNINHMLQTSVHNTPTNYPMKSMFHFQQSTTTNNNSNTTNRHHNGLSTISSSPPSYSMTAINRTTTSPSSSSIITTTTTTTSSSNDSISPKYMSQSTIDLKKTHILESNETSPIITQFSDNCGKYLTPSQSENNIINSNYYHDTRQYHQQHQQQKLSPFSARREYQKKSDVVRKLSLEEKSNSSDKIIGDNNSNNHHNHDSGGRIVRAELVNTTLSPTLSPSSKTKSTTTIIKTKDEKQILRKDSLRENIEKITQLQSKLMSAHLVDNGIERKLLGYTTKTVEIKSATTTSTTTPTKDDRKSIPTTPTATIPPITMLQSSIATITTNNTKSLNSTTPILSSISPTTEIERITKMDNEIDGLKLMQRTEIILRLNAPTMETASQTDETLETELARLKFDGDSKNHDDVDDDDDLNKRNINEISKSITPKNDVGGEVSSRKILQEEIVCDNLSKDLISHLSKSDKLHNILSPKIYKKTSDYVTNLYNKNIKVRSIKKDVGTSTLNNDKLIGCELISNNTINNNSNINLINNNINSNNINKSKSSTIEVLTSDSNYYSTTPTSTTTIDGLKLSKMMTNRLCSREMTLFNGDSSDFAHKKDELIENLGKKLLVLNKEQTIIAEESTTNDQLGNDLIIKIKDKLRPIDATKFRAYIDDVGHITMLLLSLSGRLVKVENSLYNMNENHSDKKMLQMKRDRLLEQLDEAKRLKEDIDRRGVIIGKILEKHLTKDEYDDYEYFINMKAKLIVDSREISEKIKTSEEQLNALKDTLIQSDC